MTRQPTAEETARTQAETAKLDAEIEEVKANVAKTAAEITKLNAEARKAVADAATAEELFVINRIMREEAERKLKNELASNEHHQVYLFNSAVSEATVKLCIQRLTEWHRVYPGKPFEIIFTSPGGAIIDGMALFDFIQFLRRNGHHITTSTLGYAASMAGILLQAGDTRAMGREAWLMIHEASFGAQGKIGEIEDTVEWVKKVQERVLGIFASRSKMSKRAIKSKWTRKDWWIDSDEALELGLVDELR
jgi:ATP-dependent Clp protease protease subunit